jgi:hypothetical protein
MLEVRKNLTLSDKDILKSRIKIVQPFYCHLQLVSLFLRFGLPTGLYQFLELITNKCIKIFSAKLF